MVIKFECFNQFDLDRFFFFGGPVFQADTIAFEIG